MISRHVRRAAVVMGLIAVVLVALAVVAGSLLLIFVGPGEEVTLWRSSTNCHEEKQSVDSPDHRHIASFVRLVCKSPGDSRAEVSISEATNPNVATVALRLDPATTGVPVRFVGNDRVVITAPDHSDISNLTADYGLRVAVRFRSEPRILYERRPSKSEDFERALAKGEIPFKRVMRDGKQVLVIESSPLIRYEDPALDDAN